MADGREQARSVHGAYVGVLGYLSEDAQAAVLRYLPYLDECVDNEVVRFGKELGCGLKAVVKTESAHACEQIKTAQKGTKEFKTFAEDGQRRLGDLERRMACRADATGALADVVEESGGLLRRVRAFAKHLAEFPARRTAEGLLWAMEDLKKAHEDWCAVVRRADEAAARAKEERGEQESSAGELEDKALGEIESLMRRLATGVRSLEDASHAQPHGDDGPPADDDDEYPSDDETPGRHSPAAGPAGPAATSYAVTELAELAWELPGWLQETQRRRTEALAVADESMRQKVAAAVKDISKWRFELERLLGSAEEIEKVARGLPKKINKALMAGIRAAKLDVCGSEHDQTAANDNRQSSASPAGA